MNKKLYNFITKIVKFVKKYAMPETLWCNVNKMLEVELAGKED